jgi:hypothetical protein
MRPPRFAFVLAGLAALAMLGTSAPSGAQGQGKKTYVRSGTITLSTKSIGFIIGVEWGSGTLRLNNGAVYNLRIRTLKVGMAGLEQITASGVVYNLRAVANITGNYAAAGAGITIGGGIGGAVMENAKGVTIELRETAQGLAAKIAASGIEIQLR